jgi:hypothetical protein
MACSTPKPYNFTQPSVWCHNLISLGPNALPVLPFYPALSLFLQYFVRHLTGKPPLFQPTWLTIYFHDHYSLLFHSIHWHTEHINFKAYTLNPVILHYNGNAMQPCPLYEDPTGDINKMELATYLSLNMSSVLCCLYLTFVL